MERTVHLIAPSPTKAQILQSMFKAHIHVIPMRKEMISLAVDFLKHPVAMAASEDLRVMFLLKTFLTRSEAAEAVRLTSSSSAPHVNVTTNAAEVVHRKDDLLSDESKDTSGQIGNINEGGPSQLRPFVYDHVELEVLVRFVHPTL
jgi:hypothetical protein